MSGRRTIGGLLAVGLLATGCGGTGSAAGSGSRPPGSATGFPLAVEDCAGIRTTFESPPRKIVTSNASGLEILLRLGAADRIIGTGFPPAKGALPDGLAARAAKVPVLGRTVIPKEKLLGSGADAYLETFGSMDAMGGDGLAPEREEYRAAGIKVVQLRSTACAAMRKGPRNDLSDVTDDIRRLGALTGTSERAGVLVDGMEARISAVRQALGDLPESRRPTYFVFDFDSGTGQPMAVCGKQVANAVITLAGARNVFGDCDSDYRQVGWEDVVGKNPDWIQLAVRSRGSAASDAEAFREAERFLTSFPATRGLAAVKEGRFVRLRSEPVTIAGVGNADAVEQIARTVHADRFEGGR
ncbi:ABC transporter substrate-binding protein [Streptomyces sp. NPDC088249]|uniref:ABC transporter substrate-binding protein n=1 Tax=Streptomyces sp. NPDC088249 TaxID=3365843 RepID=UPI00381210E6